jgi:sugar lactone lactonase YvrE
MRTFALSLAAASLAACGALRPAQNTPQPLVPPQAATFADKAKTYLYVGTSQGSASKFLVYPIDGSKPLREFDRSWDVQAMAIDRWGDIYTSDGFSSGGMITAYTPGGRSVFLTIYADIVNAVAFDRSGNLYAAAVGVAEYRPRSVKVIRRLGAGVENPDALAVDASGNVYVSSDSTTSSGLGRGSIEIFPPHGEQPLRAITDGIHTPVALAFDLSGNLYVANCPACYGGKAKGSVTEYAPGSGTPLRTLNHGVDVPYALAVGTDGTLFVANFPSYKIGDERKSFVAAYTPGSTKPSLKITDGIANPVSLAVSDDDELYVANRGTATITVYAPKSARLLRTIALTAKGPSEIGIGKD